MMKLKKQICLAILLAMLISGCASNIPTGLNIEYINPSKLENTKIAIIGGIFLSTESELLEDLPQYLGMVPEPIIPSLDNKFSHSVSSTILANNNNLTILTFDSVYNILSNETIFDKANELLSSIVMSSLTDKNVKISHGSKMISRPKQIHLDINKIPINMFSELCGILNVDAIAFTILSNTLSQYTSGGLVSSTNYSVYSVGTTQVIQYMDNNLFSLWNGYIDHSSSTGSTIGLLGLQSFNKNRVALIKHYNFSIMQTHIAENMGNAFCQPNLDKYINYAAKQRFSPFIMPKTDSDKIFINWFNKPKTTATLHIYQENGINEVKSYENNKKILHSFEIENVWELVGSNNFSFRIDAGDGFSTPLYSINKFPIN